MSSKSRKLHHPSMRMTIEERGAFMKRFRNEKGNKRAPPALLDDIFSCLHTKDLRRRSIGFFYFPEWLNICPDCRLSWDINIWRGVGINQETRDRFSQSLGHRGTDGALEREEGALNMYWLWIEVKCRDPGTESRQRLLFWSLQARLPAPITRSSSRRASKEHEMKHGRR